MPSGTHDSLQDPRNEEILVYVNGSFHRRGEASVSVFDGGYLVGDGVWEGLRLYHGALVFWQDHMERLLAGARYLMLDVGYDAEGLRDLVMKTVEANGMENGAHIRIMVTRGNKKTPSQDPRLVVGGPNIVIIPEYKTANPNGWTRGISLFTATIRRGPPDSLDPRLNCHSKLHEVVALNQALQAGADEALMLDPNGFVATCNATNFFMVKGEELWTSTGKYCMNGITRGKVLQVGRAAGIICVEKDFSLFDVYSADEAFVTGTFGGLTPVKVIDGRKLRVVGDVAGPLTERLRNLYLDEIERKVAEWKRSV